MLFKLIQLWIGPIPPQHFKLIPNRHPEGWLKTIHPYLKQWYFHPLRRRVAKYYLLFLQKFCGLKVIAITGSAGKTTTKELLFSILSQDNETLASYGNIDPVYNIPTTILKCKASTKYLVLEMGIEFPGEMTYYTWLAQPDIAIITNVNLTHTEFLKDIKTVGYEKGLIGAKASTALVITNDPNIHINTSARVYKVKTEPAKLTKDFTTIVGGLELPIIGTHLANNVALASQTAKLLGLSKNQIQLGLRQFKNTPHRLEVIKTNKHGTIIDDTYNSNPLALKAAIDTLLELAKITKKEPVLVFSQMNELGNYEQSSHKEIADYIKKNKISKVFTIGPATKNIGKHFDNQTDLIGALQNSLTAKNLTLIKGSRGWKLENVVAALNS